MIVSDKSLNGQIGRVDVYQRSNWLPPFQTCGSASNRLLGALVQGGLVAVALYWTIRKISWHYCCYWVMAAANVYVQIAIFRREMLDLN
jgi:hypothetical protein